jgi:hypothetical protein
MSLPNVRKGDHNDEMRRSLRLLTITNIVKIEGEESLLNIVYIHCGPQEFADDFLPYCSFGSAVKQEMFNGIDCVRADDTHG